MSMPVFVTDDASRPSYSPQRGQTHPLGPLGATELSSSAALIQQLWPRATELQFKIITLQEPEKAAVLEYIENRRAGQNTPIIERRSFVNYYVKNTAKFHEAIVNLTHERVERNVRLGPYIHGNADSGEVMEIEELVLQDAGVKAEIENLKLPEGSIVVTDPWTYGSDGDNDANRLYQCFLYVSRKSEPDFNHYAMPLTISPVVDAATMKVVRIEYLPSGADGTVKPPAEYQMPLENEYLPESQEHLRHNLKPIQVSQPQGTSFHVSQWSEMGEAIDWQKWHFKLAFNQREGIVLYEVSYDGRPLFYRMSLSDMNVPYGDPRHPYHKKAAFDLGDNGAGLMANNLQLGCDCLGVVHYHQGVIADDKGQPKEMQNVICIHEQDAGIGWKHTNYRTGRPVVTRDRELVIQSVMTVANYEYIVAFIFNLAGEISYEVRATGILSTAPIDPGVTVPWGTIVHPGALASVHQHIFSLRLDPQIDGCQSNRVVYDEAIPMPRSELNPHGTGYTISSTPVSKSGGYDLDVSTNRTYRIESSNSINPVNSKPMAYKIMAPDFQKMLSDKDSFNYRRAEFADHNLYVTKYHDGELFSGGWYTNQSRGGTGVRSWADRNDDVEDQDLVLWLQFGMNHNPRIEDFPVMPCENIKVSLKPSNFFERNPALDVPPSTQAETKSRMHEGALSAAQAVVSKYGRICCPLESSKL